MEGRRTIAGLHRELACRSVRLGEPPGPSVNEDLAVTVAGTQSRGSRQVPNLKSGTADRNLTLERWLGHHQEHDRNGIDGKYGPNDRASTRSGPVVV